MDPGTGVMIVHDSRTKLHFARTERVMRYVKGIDALLDRLSADYFLNQVDLRPGDCVVDCGANIGEVSVALRRREPALRIVTIEPEPLEAVCADMNVHSGRHESIRRALWNCETELKFYSSTDTADSSLFEPPVPNIVTAVQTTTLEKLMTEMRINHIRLLKLEAEGAEPEILIGAGEALSRIDFIAADLGPERGLKQEQTATPVINYLLNRGFELIDMRFDRVVCLFRNRSVHLDRNAECISSTT